MILLAFNCTEEENASSLATLRRRAWLALRAKIDEQTADPVLLGKLRTHFEERFRYDEDGIPRVWKPDDDIDGAFKKAKDQVRLYSYFILVPLLISVPRHLSLSLYTREYGLRIQRMLTSSPPTPQQLIPMTLNQTRNSTSRVP